MTEWMRILVVVDQDEADLVSGLVWELGVSGIEEQTLSDGQIELRIGCEAETAARVLEALNPQWTPSAESVAADEGLDSWREHAQIWRVGANIVIVPTWLQPPVESVDCELVLFIDPGHAFGSASHETTRMCLEAVVEFVTPGIAVADIGCGSGVLAIAAARRGARRVVATDISPDAIIATLENSQRNEVDHIIEVATANVGELDPSSFELVVANIGAATLCSMAAALVEITKPRGRLLLSGILDEQVESVVAAFESAGTCCSEVRVDGEWRTLVMSRPS